MTSHEAANTDPALEYAKTVLDQTERVLGAAVPILTPETPDGNPLEVLPSATAPRDDAEGLPLTEEQIVAARDAVIELGFDRPTDLTLSEQGLFGANVILEGGLPHKMMAEATMVLEDKAAEPRGIFLSASPYQKLVKDEHKESAIRQTGRAAENEYENAKDIVKVLPRFVSEGDDGVTLRLSYSLEDYSLGTETTGQFVRLGNIDGIPVILIRVDRKDTPDGPRKFKQPSAEDFLAMVSNYDEAAPATVTVTSSTYEPSRRLKAASVALRLGRVTALASYGQLRHGRVRGAPQQADIAQLPGELNKAAKEAAKLKMQLAEYQA